MALKAKRLSFERWKVFEENQIRTSNRASVRISVAVTLCLNRVRLEAVDAQSITIQIHFSGLTLDDAGLRIQVYTYMFENIDEHTIRIGGNCLHGQFLYILSLTQ